MADVEVIVKNLQRVSTILDSGVTNITEANQLVHGDGGAADDEEEYDGPSGGDERTIPITDNDVTDASDVVRTESNVEIGEEEEVDGGELTNRRKKHRRGKSKKRKWKPYNKLTWEEKRELEDREARRAHRIRAERFAHGQPVAPYNTTQFLMEDHNVQEPDLENIANGHHRQHRESTGTLDSDEYYSSPEDEEEFLQKEFCVVYDNIHAERLSSMTKLELIQEYMQLEDRVDKLEQKLKGGAGGSRDKANNEGEIKSIENLEKIRIFQQEMRKLDEENERLRRENSLLKEVRCADGPISMEQESGEDEERDDQNIM